MRWSGWQNRGNLNPKEYTCGYCGKETGTTHGYQHEGSGPQTKICICTNCGCPTFYDQNGIQHPGPLLGRNIENLPSDIAEIYREIRESIKVSNFTAAQLLGRKMIMHLAVSVAEAKEGETFVQYVEHLKKTGYVPPNGEAWINYVKEMGNEKNHEIKVGNVDEASKILKFIEVLLIFIYEFAQEAEKEANGAK